MNFQTLQKIESPDFYLDVAFRAGHEKAEKTKSSMQKNQPFHLKRRWVELDRIKIVAKVLTRNLQSILESYPQIDGLDEFYKALIKVSLDYPNLKK